MASPIFVTGATGQTGADVCEQLVERGDSVRALVRNPDEATALSEIGVELVKGDISAADDILAAAKGAEAAIHCAALLGGASQDIDDFRAVNQIGTANVLNAGRAHGIRRVVALSAASFFDLATDLPFEEAPVPRKSADDPYTITKLAAFLDAHERAAAGEDVPARHPGEIFSPTGSRPSASPTSFNRVLLAGMRGQVKRYLAFPVTWVAFSMMTAGPSLRSTAESPASVTCLPDNRTETSAQPPINGACEIAGIGPRTRGSRLPICPRCAHRRARSDPDGDRRRGGPRCAAAATEGQSDQPAIRIDPMSFDDGLRLLIRGCADSAGSTEKEAALPLSGSRPSAPDTGDVAEQILDAARTLVLRNGARRLPLTDLATMAGVSRSTVYRYFLSKEELIERWARPAAAASTRPWTHHLGHRRN